MLDTELCNIGTSHVYNFFALISL